MPFRIKSPSTYELIPLLLAHKNKTYSLRSYREQSMHGPPGHEGMSKIDSMLYCRLFPTAWLMFT